MPDTAWAILLATVIALLGWRAYSLSASGAVAATVVGTIALSAGVPWGVFLIAWFAVASVLSRAGRSVKAPRLAGVVEKPGARQATQVLANGLVFTICAAAFIATEAASSSGVGTMATSALWATAGAAALAAAGADTWGTEIGTWSRREAWSLRSASWVPAGTSGAITLLGSLGSVAGAAAFAALALGTGLISAGALPAVAMGGVAGAAADTLLGAWAQERRWCDGCASATEARRHECGAVTRVAGGVPGLQNDMVNLLATMVGAMTAVLALG